MKEIKLTGKHGIDKIAMVDDEDFEIVNSFTWYCDKIGNTFYAKRRITKSKNKSTTISLHKFLLNADKVKDIDHKDKNGLNCQRNNLRICSRSNNMHNQRIPKNNTAGFLGVYPTDSGKFTAKICLNYKIKSLGIFDTAEQAAFARDLIAKELHGEFTSLNFK